jgi:hypothetical protein
MLRVKDPSIEWLYSWTDTPQHVLVMKTPTEVSGAGLRRVPKRKQLARGPRPPKGWMMNGEEEGVRFVKGMYNHLTIHKSVGSVNGRATEFLLLRFLLVFCDEDRIGFRLYDYI